jgi:tryptophan-rich sensory protein
MKINYRKLVIAIFVCMLAGFVGSVATSPKITTWYSSLVKPWFAPPNWLFGPAWTTLYVLMGIALYLVWQKGLKTQNGKYAVYLFGFQLGLNALWSFLFFGLESPFFGLVGIAALWFAIVATIWEFYMVEKKAAYLLVPYLAWVSFASLLNYAIWALN